MSEQKQQKTPDKMAEHRELASHLHLLLDAVNGRNVLTESDFRPFAVLWNYEDFSKLSPERRAEIAEALGKRINMFRPITIVSNHVDDNGARDIICKFPALCNEMGTLSDRFKDGEKLIGMFTHATANDNPLSERAAQMSHAMKVAIGILAKETPEQKAADKKIQEVFETKTGKKEAIENNTSTDEFSWS